MDFSACKQCGKEIEGKGIQFRGKNFCGDECCELFEEKHVAVDEPDFKELDEEELELDDMEADASDDGLGYENDPTQEKVRNPLDEDDEFEIDPDDF